MPILQSQSQQFCKSYGRGIVSYFDKTPRTIVCPRFWELRWAYGCYFDCAYCYLRGTFHGNKDPGFKKLEDVLKALQAAFDDMKKPAVFNSGELSDSLMNPPMMKKIADKFEEQTKHKLLLLTKSSNVKFLLEKPRKQTIVSFSLNAPLPWRLWEKGTPSPDRRIEAARKVSEVGYELRIRIDPIFPVKDWKAQYEGLMYSLFYKLEPKQVNRITLGTPRGLSKTLRFAKDHTWERFLEERSGWGKKIAGEKRKEIYLFMYNKLCELGFPESRIAFCKETVDMWRQLGIDPGGYPNWENCRCNCVR